MIGKQIGMIGKQIGRYRIVSEIGRGGMGIVYKAIQTTLNRTVAAKMLPPQFAGSEEYLARFRREAETLACLAHEGIVHIYDIEEFEGSHFIIMEYVGGPSLTNLLGKEGRLAAPYARDITVVLANALAVAHRQGIIHRDVKPDNILFSTAGRPKLTDFGIAYIRDRKVKLSRTGLLLGTAHYMSPEQARGRPVTAASDTYSLGVVLYEMLSSQVPFGGEDALAVGIKHLQEAPRPLVELALGIPEELCRVVHRALEKDPADRYTTADEFHDSLAALDLGPRLGETLRPTGEIDPPSSCPECGAPLRNDFLTCPQCGLAVCRHCTYCGSAYDPVCPECPFCRKPPPISGPVEEFVQTGSGWSALLGVVRAAEHILRPLLVRIARPTRQRLASLEVKASAVVLWAGAALLAAVLLVASARRTVGNHPPPYPPLDSGSTVGVPASPQLPETTPPTPPPIVPVFDRNAASADIKHIIERHRQAVETDDPDRLRADMDPSLAKGWDPYVRDATQFAKDIGAEIYELNVRVADADHAQVRFRLVIRGVKKRDGKRIDLYNDTVDWELTGTRDGRWLISSSRAPR